MTPTYHVPARPSAPAYPSVALWVTLHMIAMALLWLGALLILVLFPILLLGTQAVLIRAQRGRAWVWTLATLLGLGLAITVGSGLARIVNIAFLPRLLLVLSAAGLAIGLPQSWVLWRAGGHAPWRWLGASVLGWLILGGILALLLADGSRYQLPGSDSFLAAGGWMLLAGAGYGFVTGWTMRAIVRPTRAPLHPGIGPLLPSPAAPAAQPDAWSTLQGCGCCCWRTVRWLGRRLGA